MLALGAHCRLHIAHALLSFHYCLQLLRVTSRAPAALRVEELIQIISLTRLQAWLSAVQSALICLASRAAW